MPRNVPGRARSARRPFIFGGTREASSWRLSAASLRRPDRQCRPPGRPAGPRASFRRLDERHPRLLRPEARRCRAGGEGRLRQALEDRRAPRAVEDGLVHDRRRDLDQSRREPRRTAGRLLPSRGPLHPADLRRRGEADHERTRLRHPAPLQSGRQVDRVRERPGRHREPLDLRPGGEERAADQQGEGDRRELARLVTGRRLPGRPQAFHRCLLDRHQGAVDVAHQGGPGNPDHQEGRSARGGRPVLFTRRPVHLLLRPGWPLPLRQQRLLGDLADQAFRPQDRTGRAADRRVRRSRRTDSLSRRAEPRLRPQDQGQDRARGDGAEHREDPHSRRGPRTGRTARIRLSWRVSGLRLDSRQPLDPCHGRWEDLALGRLHRLPRRRSLQRLRRAASDRRAALPPPARRGHREGPDHPLACRIPRRQAARLLGRGAPLRHGPAVGDPDETDETGGSRVLPGILPRREAPRLRHLERQERRRCLGHVRRTLREQGADPAAKADPVPGTVCEPVLLGRRKEGRLSEGERRDLPRRGSRPRAVARDPLGEHRGRTQPLRHRDEKPWREPEDDTAGLLPRRRADLLRRGRASREATRASQDPAGLREARRHGQESAPALREGRGGGRLARRPLGRLQRAAQRLRHGAPPGWNPDSRGLAREERPSPGAAHRRGGRVGGVGGRRPDADMDLRSGLSPSGLRQGPAPARARRGEGGLRREARRKGHRRGRGEEREREKKEKRAARSRSRSPERSRRARRHTQARGS